MKIIKILICMILLVGCSTKVTIPPGEEKPQQPQQPHEVVPALTFNLDDTQFEFPLSLTSFLEDGWETKSNLNEGVIEANTFIPNYFFRKGTSIVKVSLYNPNKNDISLKESLISEIAFENRTFKTDVAPKIKVNEFLDFTTSIAEIEKQFGTATFTEDAVFEYYEFNLDTKNTIRVDIYKDRRDGDVSRWITLTSYES